MASADNTPLDLHNSSDDTKTEFNKIIVKYKQHTQGF